MKIIFEGNKEIVNVEEFTLDDVETLMNLGKQLYVADGNVVVEG